MFRHGRGEEIVTRKRDIKTAEYVFSCNREGCGAEVRTKARNPTQAWGDAKRQGWVSAKVGPVWLHWCCWVHRPNRDDQIPPHLLGGHDGVSG